MAAEDFSLPNLTEKRSSGRTRGRGLADRSKRPATRFSKAGNGKEKYMRTRSASFSGTVDDTRACRLSIATSAAKRGEVPVLATMDKSGKILIDRQKGGQGEFSRGGRRFRANSLLSRGRYYNASYVPGGTSSDPLNLQVENLPETPQVPQPDPKRFDRPANNFIPTNQWDPLGLTNDDESVPVCLTYNLNATKRKRVRARKKDPAAQASAESANTSHSNDTTVDSNAGLPGAKASSVPNTKGDATVSDIPSGPTEPNAIDSSHVPDDEKSPVKDVSMEQDFDNKKTEESAGTGDHSIQDPKSSDDVKSSTAGVSDTDTKPTTISVPDSKPLLPNTGAKPCTGGVSQHAKNVHPREKNEAHPYRPGRIEPKVKNERERAAFEMFHRRTQNYPIMPSPIDVREKNEIPRDRKSLLEALKIEQMGKEERERIIKEQQKEQRNFRRQRFPNLKSPVEEDGTANCGQSVMEPLTVDVDHTGKPVVTGQLSRTLDSIVSPKFQPHQSHIRKRRRTISDCSADSGIGAARSLSFRRSSSPDVIHASTPSPKKRRLSCGSGSGKFKKKGEQAMDPPKVKFAKNPVFKYGNYYRYYGYRTPEMESDFRLRYFKMDWFEGKDVLDIGCNSGHVTLAIAQLFHPQKIVGMDIDPNLIRVARQNIKSYQTLANQNETKKYPVSMSEYGPIEPLPALTNPSNYFPKNIMFMQGNYVLDRDEQLNYVKQEYDTILALSITKWIHLNTGDEGLKRAFARMFQQLRPGGRLILEPQAWVSYRRRKKLTETIYKNYNSIKLRPEEFSDYLLNQVGFCKREVIGVPAHPSKGFQRQLLLFTKFSDQSSSPPNLVPPYPSGPRPVYSIAERMTSLAGYTSTPASVGTPGVSTPTVQPPSFQIGESTPLNCSASYASSSSLCSTCMSRASTGPHESDSDYMGYPSNLPDGFPFESSSPNSSSQANSMGLPGFGNDRSVGVLDVAMDDEGQLQQPFVNGQLEQSEADDMFEENWQNNFVQQNVGADAATDNSLSEPEGGGAELQNGGMDVGEGGDGGWGEEGIVQQQQVEVQGQPSAQLPPANTPSWQDSPHPVVQDDSDQAAVCSQDRALVDGSQQGIQDSSLQAGGDSSEQATQEGSESGQIV
ncbi:hypothetical protein V1264_007709 [Littorina saxatilis]|uniref:RNA methyltransferase n=3 Tax=Littorina saxatilis TaxID=31220 RepID=A0AAN9AVZ7_9CAEN